MHVTQMPGLAAGPMGNWLAAVGVLRMQSRLDPDARLHWDGPVPVLATRRPALVRDLADRADFTPVITPWQAGGGWGEKDRTPARQLAALRDSRTPRLGAMRRAIAVADTVMAARAGEDKDTLVGLLRNALPDEAVPWLDAAVPLVSVPSGPQRATAAFAPLAGTGGNDARWDLSANYHAAILAVDPQREPEADGSTPDPVIARRRGLLHDLLDGTAHQQLAEMSSGPYWPGATDAKHANPWALILLAEGLCAFGDARVRVFAGHAQPWTAAAGPEADRLNRGEAWLPMWGAPATMSEAALLLGGPQPRWRGAGARTPAQMYASLRTGGWPAGVTGYARYGLAQRRGQGHVAVPLDIVTPQTAAQAMLTGAQAAGLAGIAESTWRGYVARGHAPQPDERDLRSGKPGWLESTVTGWLAARPGRGARTDL